MLVIPVGVVPFISIVSPSLSARLGLVEMLGQQIADESAGRDALLAQGVHLCFERGWKLNHQSNHFHRKPPCHAIE